MDTRAKQKLTARLEVLRRRFERYRRMRKGRSPIPNGLWIAAAKTASRLGINRTAKALRLNYYDLKKRVEEHAAVALVGSKPKASQFIEILGPADRARPTPIMQALHPAGGCNCTVELEDLGGDKMRIHLQIQETPDLVELGRSFWSRRL
jgi:hypothetical protein